MGGGSRVSDHLHSEIEEQESSNSCKSSFNPKTPSSSDAGSSDEAGLIARRRCNTHLDLMQSYEPSAVRVQSIQETKNAIQRHKPGDWIEEVGGTKACHYDVPERITLLLVGPRGSGKSSLVNRITRVFEDDPYSPDRAQVSHNLSATQGSCFLQEYLIPRNSTSLCVYDTRSLSMTLYDNFKTLKRWMTQGVTHGEMIIRDSDGDDAKKKMKAMARQGLFSPCQKKIVNFVIFVVDGISVLKSWDGKDTQYNNMIVETFNYPFLSFKDNKPAVVVTHGDELTLDDRARVRIHLGELLGIPPAQQIFDIPDTSSHVTEMAILDMLRYSIDHADRNLPFRYNYLLERYLPSMDRLQALEVVFQVVIICVCFIVLLLRGPEKLLKW